jgi:ABC-type Mn2+/Zn2+ transport system ATPase subunit
MTDTCVRLSDVVAGYPGRQVLGGTSFEVAGGEYVGVVGPNGVGKTTLFRVILGLLRPYRGTVQVLGVPLVTRQQISAVRRQVGYVPQQSSAGRLPISVFDAVLIGRWGSSFRAGRRPAREDREAVERALEVVGLFDHRYRDWRELSGGLQQRAALARAMVREPRLVLMDEPTTFLDPESQESIFALASALNRDQGISFLVISHDRALLAQHCSRIVTIGSGGLIEEIAACRT